jgi:hypothetical protein
MLLDYVALGLSESWRSLSIGRTRRLRRLSAPRFGNRGIVDLQRIMSDLRTQPAVLIVWPSGYTMPREILLAADRVVDVGPVRPSHLVAAAKQFAGQTVEANTLEEGLTILNDAKTSERGNSSIFSASASRLHCM